MAVADRRVGDHVPYGSRREGVTTMKFTFDDAFHWGDLGFEGWSYGNKDVSPFASASVVALDGNHGAAKSPVSDRLIYVLEGAGEFTVGAERHSVAATDVVMIPKHTPFDVRGKLRYLVVHMPAYDHEAEFSSTS
jgi:mannose-6-phosphate isomerase-like protein (cupin superfamily)